MTHPDSPLQTPSKAVRQELQSQGIDPLRESLDAFAALEGGPGGLLDFEAAAAVPEKELKKYLQASQIDGSLLANFRQVSELLFAIAWGRSSCSIACSIAYSIRNSKMKVLCVCAMLNHDILSIKQQRSLLDQQGQ